MKKKYFFFSFFLFSFSLYSQSEKRKSLSFSNTEFKIVITKIEKSFNVKYSYADSLFIGKTISLGKKEYSIEEVNSTLEKLLTIKIESIDQHYYYITKPYLNVKQDAITKLEEVTIKGFLVNGITKFDEKLTLDPKKMQILPGLTDEDVLLAIQQLPGVRSPNKTVTGLAVRGGTTDQNLLVWDGIRIYHSGHLFGMISPINPNIVKSVDFINKATNPYFGERISSVIDLKSSSSISNSTQIDGGINALSVDFYTKTPLIKNKLGIQVSFRKSFTEWLQLTTFNQLAKKVFQNTSFKSFKDKNDFGFEDVSIKLDYKPKANSEFTFSSIYINNQLNYTNILDNSAKQNHTLYSYNYGFSSTWKQNYNPSLSHVFRVYYSAYEYDYKRNNTLNANTFGSFKKNNRIIDSGAEIGFKHKINNNLKTEFGYQITGQAVSHILDGFNQDLGVIISESQSYIVSNNVYGNLTFQQKKWKFNIGSRHSYFNIRAYSFEPRIQILNKINDNLTLHTSFEQKSQIISQIKENIGSDLSLENYVWTNGYLLQKANQTTIGLTYKKGNWFIDIDCYYKSITGDTSFLFDFQDENKTAFGSGFTKGIDFSYQKKLSSTSRIWFTYSYQDALTKFDGINNNNYFKSSAAIDHSVNININKRLNDFAFSVGWFWHSGKPFSVLNQDGEIERYNTLVLPSYHRLDATVAYEFNKEKIHYKIGAAVQNLYNYSAIINKELERNYKTIEDFSNPNYYINTFFAQAITPNLFLRISF